MATDEKDFTFTEEPIDGVKRSELRTGMFVRIRRTFDECGFTSRLLAGRYLQIDDVDASPDDATCFGPCVGAAIYWGMNYVVQVFNSDMVEIVPLDEATRILYIFTSHAKEFSELFSLGRHIERVQERLQALARDLGSSSTITEFHAVDAFISDIQDGMNDDEIEFHEGEFDDIRTLWADLEASLRKLDELERKHITQAIT